MIGRSICGSCVAEKPPDDAVPFAMEAIAATICAKTGQQGLRGYAAVNFSFRRGRIVVMSHFRLTVGARLSMRGRGKNGDSRMRKISTAIVALATLTLAAPASAGEIWLNGWSPTSGAGSGDRYFSDGTVNVRVSAWSIDDGGIIRDAPLDMWDYGLGVRNGSGDNSHTVDNSGWNDFLLFQFDQTVELNSAMFVSGWHDMYDTDATIGYASLPIAYTTPLSLGGSPESILDGANLYQSNDSSGFNWAPDFNTRGINPNDYTGNFWLIGASFDSPDRYYDGFKLKKLTYSVAPPPSVPEPATWLMLILGFGLVGGVMRREKRKDVVALA